MFVRRCGASRDVRSSVPQILGTSRGLLYLSLLEPNTQLINPPGLRDRLRHQSSSRGSAEGALHAYGEINSFNFREARAPALVVMLEVPTYVLQCVFPLAALVQGTRF